MVLRVLRTLALVALFSTAAAYESTQLAALNAPEVWVHLQTGTWMLENHAVPRTGLFSRYPNLSWRDSTWGFDLLLGVAYRIFGLRAIVLLLMVMKAAIAVVAFLLARSGRAGFWQSVMLSAIAQFVIQVQPLPFVASVLFFAIELSLLVSSRISGSMRGLYWLPLLFLIWANVHIQFVVGLILLAIFLIALAIEQWWRSREVRWLSPRIFPQPLAKVSFVATLSLLATFATPYGYRLFIASLSTAYSDVAFQHFSEMSAMSFRRPQDYALMLLVMMAFLALGRRRALELFELLILLGITALAFRIVRDGWMVALAAIAVLSTSSWLQDQASELGRGRAGLWEWGVAAATALVLTVPVVRLSDQNALMNRVNRNFPVKACDYISANRLPGPLFNEYSWGSFLTWYLPDYPVVADSRVEFYGDKLLGEYFDVVGGKERLDSHPMVARAGSLLLARNSAMGKALTNLPGLRAQYRLVYSDAMADVFVPANRQ